MAVNTRRRRKNNPMGPLLAWTDLAFDTAQTLAASAQVIAHRSSRPASPVELYEMGSEKVEAAMHAQHAMLLQMFAMRTATPATFWTSYARLLANGLKPVKRRAVSNARRFARD